MITKNSAKLIATVYNDYEGDQLKVAHEYIKLKDDTIMKSDSTEEFITARETDLIDLATMALNPWSSSSYQFKIRENNNGYDEPVEGTPKFYCEYTAIYWEKFSVSIWGYGETEEGALKDCKNTLQSLEKYNIEE